MFSRTRWGSAGDLYGEVCLTVIPIVSRKYAFQAVIADPALHSLGGHHYVASERLSLELSRLSAKHLILGAKGADDEVFRILGARNSFSELIYGRTDRSDAEFNRRASALARDLLRAVRWQWPDLLVLPTCDQVVAYATALALGKSLARWRPTVLLWLLFPPDDEQSWEEYRKAFAALRSVIGDDRKLYLCCETPGAVRDFSEVLGVSVELRPGPNAIGNEDLREYRKNVPPVVACVGHASAAKGYRHLPEALSLALRENPASLFRVHGFVDRRDMEADQVTFDRLSALGTRVQITNRVLSTSEYRKFLNAADVILLPYDPVAYRARGSGIFNEAVLCGKPVIAPLGCSFAEEALADERAVAIARLEPLEIAKSINQALNDLKSMSERARIFALGQHTNSLEQLLRTLLGSSRA